jgi:hypothetical protein
MKARGNPFSMDRVERFRYRPIEGTWVKIMERLKGMGHRAAIVGPEGSGKAGRRSCGEKEKSSG